MIFAARTRAHVVITVFLAVMMLIAFAVYDATLHRGAYLSGWVLLVLVLFLALFNVRKKLTMLPLLPAAVWMQFHIYAGVLAILVFFEHIGWRLPAGGLEITLAAVFALAALSGVFGLVLAKLLPPRLTRRGEQLLFERIPVFIAELRKEAEGVAVLSAIDTRSTTISDFYLRRLAPFFIGPQNQLRHLMASRQARFELLNEIENLQRYLNAQEKEYALKLRELVNKKDELDFHYSLNLALKAWLLVHVPMTYSLLMLAAVHLVVVYAYGGGVG